MKRKWYWSSDGPTRYPESESSKPLGDSTRHAHWVFLLYGNLQILFRDRADVFVASDLSWYPVEGDNKKRMPLDVLVVLGRPREGRSAYRQWEEENVPVTVVFDVASPEQWGPHWLDREAFYDEHGVEEWYFYDPNSNWLSVQLRRDDYRMRVRPKDSFVSPRLGIRFDLSGPEMRVCYPDGRPFLSFEELEQERNSELQKRLATEKWAARLAELSRKARGRLANPEELAELERLEERLASTDSKGKSWPS